MRRPGALAARLRARRDQGSVTPMMLIMAGGILILIGLTYDGGNYYSDQQHADFVAQEAARAGAQDIDVNYYLATGQAAITAQTQALATTDATSYLSHVKGLTIKDPHVYFSPSGREIQVTFLVDRTNAGVFMPASWWHADKVYGNAVVVLEQGVTSAGG